MWREANVRLGQVESTKQALAQGRQRAGAAFIPQTWADRREKESEEEVEEDKDDEEEEKEGGEKEEEELKGQEHQNFTILRVDNW